MKTNHMTVFFRIVRVPKRFSRYGRVQHENERAVKWNHGI
jgi:hypothetical protein